MTGTLHHHHLCSERFLKLMSRFKLHHRITIAPNEQGRDLRNHGQLITQSFNIIIERLEAGEQVLHRAFHPKRPRITESRTRGDSSWICIHASDSVVPNSTRSKRSEAHEHFSQPA